MPEAWLRAGRASATMCRLMKPGGRIIVIVVILLAAGAVAWVVSVSGTDKEVGRGMRAKTDQPQPPRVPCGGGVRAQVEFARQAKPGDYIERDKHGNVVFPCIEPGEIYAGADPSVSPETMWPVTNAWRAGNHHETTVVSAGRSAHDRSLGMLVVSRFAVGSRVPGAVIEVPGAGTVRITDGPLGRSVVGWAPSRAEISFKGRSGITGTLDLRTDSISLD
jgi:hypothetical protein